MHGEALKNAVGSIINGLESNIDEWQEPLEDLNSIDLRYRQAGVATPHLIIDAIITLENDQGGQGALAILNEMHAAL
jgi:hypothetical protein